MYRHLQNLCAPYLNVVLRSSRYFSILQFQTFFSLKVFKSSPKNMSNIPIKPPNILVYVGENEKDVFKNIAANLLSCLHPDKYVVYRLKKNQVLNSPWKENVELLVVYCEIIQDAVLENFQDYIESGGNMLVFCSNINSKKLGLECITAADDEIIEVKCTDSTELEFVLYHGKYNYTLQNGQVIATNSKGQSVVMKSKFKDSALIVSEVHFALDPSLLPKSNEKMQASEQNRLLLLKKILKSEFGCEVSSLTKPMPTSGYVIAVGSEVPSRIKNIKEISLGTYTSNKSTEEGSEIVVPLLAENESANSIFDKSSYFLNLKTKNIGRIVVFFPVVTSTMTAAAQLSDHENIVVIATRQLSGSGRSGNVWLSPEGCAMYTLPLSLSLTSRIGQRISILQHMASLAVVHSIRKDPSYSKLDLRLKWPNDIYFENDKKIGGVLVNTTVQGSSARAFIGVGVNVANPLPTVCINSVIESHNALIGGVLPLLSTEKVIAGALNELEYLIDDFEKNGSKNFLRLYYSYWLHNEQRVEITSLKKEAVIHGLDDYGFLIVQTVDGKRLTLQPDGNRFDMLKNLIVAKE